MNPSPKPGNPKTMQTNPRQITCDRLRMLGPGDDTADIVAVLIEFLRQIEDPVVAREAGKALERIYGNG